jgi:hypothetical protein
MSGKRKNLAIALLAVPAALGLWVIGFAVTFAMPSKGTKGTKPPKKATNLLPETSADNVGRLWTHGPR